MCFKIDRSFFKQLRLVRKRIIDLQERRRELRFSVERITQNLTGMPSSHDSSDKMIKYVSDADELDSMIVSEIKRLEEMRANAEKAIEALPIQQSTVIRLRHLECMSWKAISIETGYHEDHCRKIERKAIENVLGRK